MFLTRCAFLGGDFSETTRCKFSRLHVGTFGNKSFCRNLAGIAVDCGYRTLMPGNSALTKEPRAKTTIVVANSIARISTKSFMKGFC